ncbi:hypothetical protein AURDEDRAFT_185375 [Auricularia subglabra TFB-10046 SS5]|nr:hypothetical protein AURDEDRAFT_185375 [Auricularia subglabra TFB-10046 SS5]
MSIDSLPSELLLVVLDHASRDPSTFDLRAPDVFAYPPSPSYRDRAAALRASMPTKLALTGVCSAWRALAERYVYAAVTLVSLESLPKLCRALCRERGARPDLDAYDCLTQPPHLIPPHLLDSVRHGKANGWWTKRLDLVVSNVPELPDNESSDTLCDNYVFLISLLLRACPNLQTIINSVKTPHWFNLVCMKAATGINRRAIRVVYHEVHTPLSNPRRLSRFLREARNLCVFDGSVEICQGDVDETTAEESDGDDLTPHRAPRLSLPYLTAMRVPTNESRYVEWSRADLPLLRAIKIGFVNFGDDDTYLRRFLATHDAINSVEFMEEADSASWDTVFTSGLPLARLVFDHAFHHRVRLAKALPPTVTHIGVRFRRLQASRADHRAFFANLALFEHARVVRFLHPRLVADLTERHQSRLSTWFGPLALRGVRLEDPNGDLLWPLF